MLDQAGSAREILLTGRNSPPRPWRALRAGDLTLALDGADLRQVAWRGVEVVQQVYVALRDLAWNSLPGIVGDIHVDESSTGFEVTFQVRHDFPGLAVDADWQGHIEGSANGHLAYEMILTANAPLTYNRCGLNVLHGARTYAGAGFRSWLGDSALEGQWPVGLAPQAFVGERLTGMTPPFRRIELEPVDGFAVDLAFDGDEFEAEDQRNFGDGTFKIYSTPLQRPGPFRLEPGATLRQSLRLHVSDRRAKARLPGRPSLVTVTVGAPTSSRVPRVGLGHDPGPVTLTGPETAALADLAPAHLHVDLAVPFDIGAARVRLAETATLARAIECDVRVGLTLDPAEVEELLGLVRSMRDLEPVPTDLFVASTIDEPPDHGISGEVLARVRKVAEEATPGMRVGAGAKSFLADLLRAPFDGAIVRSMAFPLAPTVHRADDASILENLDRLGDGLTAARIHLGDRPVHVGPISLATRSGPYPNGPRSDGEPPARVDHRQASLLGAAWTAGCLSALAAAGADVLTFFETVGWLGVRERDSGSPLPEQFPSLPGAVFPLYHVVRDAIEWQGAAVHALEIEPAPTFTPAIAALAVSDPAGLHLLVASLARETRRVEVRGLPGAFVDLRVLDAASARAAMLEPDVFRKVSQRRALDAGSLTVTLDSFAIVRMDTGWHQIQAD